MANEATVQSGFTIIKDNLRHQEQTSTFQVTIDNGFGPTPGAILATVDGTDVDLSALVTPGLTKIKNLDQTNFVTVGLWDSGAEVFTPALEIGPGEEYAVKLSRYLGDTFTSTGTGVAGNVSLRIKADTDDCNVVVLAFDK